MAISSFADACTALGLVPFPKIGELLTLQGNLLVARKASVRERLSESGASTASLQGNVEILARLDAEAEVVRELFERHRMIAFMGERHGVDPAGPSLLEQFCRFITESIFDDLGRSDSAKRRAAEMALFVRGLAQECARLGFEALTAPGAGPAAGSAEVA